MDLEHTTRQISPAISPSVGKVYVFSPDFTYLQMAHVWVTGPTALGKLMRCVLDGRSQCSFVVRSIIDDLQVRVIDHRDLSVTTFKTCSPVWSLRRFVRLGMIGIWTNSCTPVTAFESTHIFSPHPAFPHDTLINCSWQTQRTILKTCLSTSFWGRSLLVDS